LFVAEKLKNHRLKPGGVAPHHPLAELLVAEKVKNHQLKPGGVAEVLFAGIP
jgi:hypothetical protein